MGGRCWLERGDKSYEYLGLFSVNANGIAWELCLTENQEIKRYRNEMAGWDIILRSEYNIKTYLKVLD